MGIFVLMLASAVEAAPVDHIVAFNFLPSVDEDTVQKVAEKYLALKELCVDPNTNQTYIVYFSGGVANSKEGTSVVCCSLSFVFDSFSRLFQCRLSAAYASGISHDTAKRILSRLFRWKAIYDSFRSSSRCFQAICRSSSQHNKRGYCSRFHTQLFLNALNVISLHMHVNNNKCFFFLSFCFLLLSHSNRITAPKPRVPPSDLRGRPSLASLFTKCHMKKSKKQVKSSPSLLWTNEKDRWRTIGFGFISEKRKGKEKGKQKKVFSRKKSLFLFGSYFW